MSSINAQIIDQRVQGLAKKLQIMRKSEKPVAPGQAFLALVCQVVFDLTSEEVEDAIVDGSNDFGVDAIVLGDIRNDEFEIALVQAKYRQDLNADVNFPQVGIEKINQAVGLLFDTHVKLQHINPRLEAIVEQARSRISDGIFPRIRVVLANNGATWVAASQELIDLAAKRFGDQVVWEYVNHDRLIELLRKGDPITDHLSFKGKSLLDNLSYSRALVGKVAVSDIQILMQRYGDRLLEKNIRRYLGIKGDVNKAIADTLQDPQESPNFYFYNNGITIVCTRLVVNYLQAENWNVKLENMAIVNGGQTAKTIQTALRPGDGEHAYVLVRVYELPEDNSGLLAKITQGTNSQNPVKLRDLRSNDPRQQQLELNIQDLGYVYLRHRGEGLPGDNEITLPAAAEAVLAVWRRQPNKAQHRRDEHFDRDRLYNIIFAPSLNGAQVVIAHRIYKFAQHDRDTLPDELRYASAFVAMLMGQYLLADLNKPLAELDHRSYGAAEQLLRERLDNYRTRARAAVRTALHQLGVQGASLQRLASIFRGGQLLPALDPGLLANDPNPR